MAALTVIQYFDLFTHCRLGLLMRVKVLQIEQFRLSGVQEALRHGILPTVALAAHTRLYPVRPQELSIALHAILTATVAMHDEPRSRLTLTERHRSCLVAPLGPPMVRHRPSDHGPRAQL